MRTRKRLHRSLQLHRYAKPKKKPFVHRAAVGRHAQVASSRPRRCYELISTNSAAKWALRCTVLQCKLHTAVAVPVSATTMTIKHLPRPLLSQILGYINVWHYKRIRDVSQFFRQLHDEHLMHQFLHEQRLAQLRRPNSYKCAALTTLKLAAADYLQAGYASVFCGCLLPMLRHCYRHPYAPDLKSVSRCLLHFLQVVDDAVQMQSKDAAMVLYTLTLLRLFMSYPKKCVSYVVQDASQMTVTLQLEGAWVGYTSLSHSKRCSQSRRCSFIAILGELLIAHKCNRNLKCFFESGSTNMLIYGHEPQQQQKSLPNTWFQLQFTGAAYLLPPLQKILTDGPESYQFEWPAPAACAEFQFYMKICTGRCMKWCTTRQQLFRVFEAEAQSKSNSS